MRRPYYGWIVVLACFLGTFVVFGLSYSFGVFLERMADDFARSRGVTTIAFGVQTLMLYVGAVLVGVFVDRLGTRRMLAVGTVVLCLGLVGTSLARSWLTVVLAYGVVTGIGMSIVYVVAYATVPRWFDRRAGFAGGIASAGLGIGMLVVAPAATALIDRVGWRSSFLVLAGAVTVPLLAATVLIRDGPTTESIPSDEFAAGGRPFEADGDGGSRAEQASRQPSLREQFAGVYAIARSPSFVLVFVGWVLIYTTMYVVFVHLVVYASDVGLSRTAGATGLAVIGGANAVGRVGIGYVSDYVGRVRVFAGCSAVMGISTLVLPSIDTTLALLGFALVFGLAYGGNGALLAPLTGDLFGRANLNAVFGLISGAFALSGLVSPFLAGVGYDTFGTYDPAFAVAGVAAVFGAIAIVAAGRLQRP